MFFIYIGILEDDKDTNKNDKKVTPSLLEAAEVAIREWEKVAAGFDLSVSVKITCYANKRRFYTPKTETFVKYQIF